MLLNAQEVTTHTWIPQFEVEYEVELKEVLEKMGILDAFNAQKADLSNLGTSTNGNL